MFWFVETATICNGFVWLNSVRESALYLISYNILESTKHLIQLPSYGISVETGCVCSCILQRYKDITNSLHLIIIGIIAVKSASKSVVVVVELLSRVGFVVEFYD